MNISDSLISLIVLLLAIIFLIIVYKNKDTNLKKKE